MPLITAHEGSEGSVSNTLESVQAGISSGADIIEVDVRSTKDDIAILSHSEHIETSSYKVNISEKTLNELLSLEKRQLLQFQNKPGKITTLVDVFDLIKNTGKVLNLDVKDIKSIPSMVSAIKSEKMLDNVFISGCERESASFISKCYPELQVLLNIGNSVSSLFKGNNNDAVKTICRQATLAGCCGLNIPYQLCTQEFVNYAQMRFLPVSVWTIDDTEVMNNFINMGVYSITTNRPGILKKLLSH